MDVVSVFMGVVSMLMLAYLVVVLLKGGNER